MNLFEIEKTKEEFKKLIEKFGKEFGKFLDLEIEKNKIKMQECEIHIKTDKYGETTGNIIGNIKDLQLMTMGLLKYILKQSDMDLNAFLKIYNDVSCYTKEVDNG